MIGGKKFRKGKKKNRKVRKNSDEVERKRKKKYIVEGNGGKV